MSEITDEAGYALALGRLEREYDLPSGYLLALMDVFVEHGISIWEIWHRLKRGRDGVKERPRARRTDGDRVERRE